MSDDRKTETVKFSPFLVAAASTIICQCSACPNVHIFLLDEQEVAFAVMTFDKDWAPIYAAHLIEHYGPPQHGEELTLLAGMGLK